MWEAALGKICLAPPEGVMLLRVSLLRADMAVRERRHSSEPATSKCCCQTFHSKKVLAPSAAMLSRGDAWRQTNSVKRDTPQMVLTEADLKMSSSGQGRGKVCETCFGLAAYAHLETDKIWWQNRVTFVESLKICHLG